MSIRTEDLLERRNVVIRDDAAIPLEVKALIHLVYDAVAHVNWLPSYRLPGADSTPEPILRTVLTFCYATGIYSSGEIEAAAEHDAIVQYLCANHRPHWETIREFRRTNVPSLKIALARVFKSALHDGSPL